MARKEAMAQIDAMLLDPEKPTPIAPPPTPGLTPEKAEERANKKIADIEKAEQEQLEQQKESRDAITEQAGNAVAMLSDLLKSIQSALGNIPTYGSIMFPLSILLIFFFLLLPVNGHTRAVWLWLTLTGHAEIAPIGGGASGDFGTPTPAAPATGEFSFSEQQLQLPPINFRSFQKEDWM